MSPIFPALPDHELPGGLLLSSQRSLGFELGLIGSDQRDPEVQHGATLDDEADASQQSIDFPIRSETVAIDQRQALCLLYQFVVCHEFPRQGRYRQHDRIVFGVHRKCDAGLQKVFLRRPDLTGGSNFSANFHSHKVVADRKSANPNSSAFLPDEWRRPSLPIPGEPPVTAGVYNFARSA